MNPGPSFPGYLHSDASTLAPRHLYAAGNLHGTPSDYRPSDMLPLYSSAYALDDVTRGGTRVTPMLGELTPGGIKGYPASVEGSAAIGHRLDPALGAAGVGIHVAHGIGELATGTLTTSLEDMAAIGQRHGPVLGSTHVGSHMTPGIVELTAGTSLNRYPNSMEHPAAIGQRHDPALGTPGVPDILPERSSLIRKADGAPSDESNVLFVDGLPPDCTRREVAHLFRPFIGFKEIRVIHREPRRSGEKAVVICFVEFSDAKCALTALEALQGYKFDDKKPDAPALKIKLVHFPFRPDQDDHH